MVNGERRRESSGPFAVVILRVSEFRVSQSSVGRHVSQAGNDIITKGQYYLLSSYYGDR